MSDAAPAASDPATSMIWTRLARAPALAVLVDLDGTLLPFAPTLEEAALDDAAAPPVLVVGLVGGIGFTMSIFIAQLAFPPGPLLETAKLAVLVASGTASLAGLAVGRWGGGATPAPAPGPPATEHG